MSDYSTILYYFYAPELAPFGKERRARANGVGRLLAAMSVLDELIPALRLAQAVTAEGGGEPVPPEAREAWLRHAVENEASLGVLPTLLSADLAPDAFVKLGWNSLAWQFSPGRQEPVVSAMIETPDAAPYHEIAEGLLARVGDALHAYQGHVVPSKAFNALVEQTSDAPGSEQARAASPFGLPPLYRIDKMPDVFTPAEVGWINYWSPRTCELLGLLEQDAHLFASLHRSDAGAVLARVTDEPLDPTEHASHVERLAALYERFPRIGARDGNVSPTPQWPVRSTFG
jgi:hypothetical protein